MSVTSLARYGTTETPDIVRAQNRKRRFADRKLLNKERAAYNQRIAAAKPLVSFDADDARRLMDLARTDDRSGSFWRKMALAHREGDQMQVRVEPEAAKVWAAWMRLPGVDAFGPTLTQVEAAAGLKPSKGAAIALHINDFLATLVALEADAAASIPDAGPAANFLRLKACFERGLIHVYVTPARAARLADVFAAAGIARTHIVALDRIAGRPEPRAF